ncbi:MAG: hypothetical protein ACUVUS_02290 [Thermoproteota archaeon]
MNSKYVEVIERIIQLCDEVMEKNLDPFIVNVKDSLRKLRAGLSEMDEGALVMDMTALLKLIYIIALQQEDVKKRASKLYLDPFLMEVRLMGLGREKLAESFLRAFRPVAENEHATMGLMRMAYYYWVNLKDYRLPEGGENYSIEVLDRLSELLPMEEVDLEEEMNKMISEIGPRMVDYYDFINREGEEKRVFRAVILSFLVTKGLAGMLQDPLKDKTWVYRTNPKDIERHSVALPI